MSGYYCFEDQRVRFDPQQWGRGKNSFPADIMDYTAENYLATAYPHNLRERFVGMNELRLLSALQVLFNFVHVNRVDGFFHGREDV